MTPLTPEEEQAAIDWAKQVLDPDTGYGRGTKDWNMARALLSLKGKLFTAENGLCAIKTVLGCQIASTEDAIHVVIAKDEALEELRSELTEARRQLEIANQVLSTKEVLAVLESALARIAEPAPQTEGK